MDPKLDPHQNWQDPALEGVGAELLLARLWFKTCGAHNKCGALRFSASIFELQTSLPPEVAEAAIAQFPDLLKRTGQWVLVTSFVREQMGLAASALEGRGRPNNVVLAILRDLARIPAALQQEFLEAYPEFRSHQKEAPSEPLASPFGAPCKPLRSPLQAPSEPLQNGCLHPKNDETEAPWKPLGSPLEAPPKGPLQHSTAQHSTAHKGVQGETDDVAIPSVEEVVAHGAGPAGIPAEFCATYHAKCEEGRRWLVTTPAGPALRDWRRELVRWWANDRAMWRPRNPSAPVQMPQTAPELDAAIAAETDTARRLELRKHRAKLFGSATEATPQPAGQTA